MKHIIISDVDGILTTGVLGYTKHGKIMKFFGGHDKEAVQYAIDAGYEILFVSDDKIGWEITKTRLAHLQKINPEKISYKIASANEREQIVKNYIANGYDVYFIGDSISDIKAGSIATKFATTNNALDFVKNEACYVSLRNGGEGGFADIVYKLLNFNENIIVN